MNNLSRFLARRGVIYGIIVLSIFVLLGINFWGWFFVRSFQDRILLQLQRQLQQTVPLYARQIGDEFFAQGGTGLSTLDWREPLLQSRLYDIESELNAQNVYLVSLDRQIVLTNDLQSPPGNLQNTLPVNDSLFSRATLGVTPQPELLSFASTYFLTAYAAVSDGFGDPVAVLVMEAPAELFSTVVFIRQALIYTGLAGLLIIIVFAALIWSAIRQLFKAEAELNAQSSLAQLGQMAAMVAHEIRNPLSIIKGSAEVLRKKHQDSGDELFDFIPAEIDRLNRLVNEFLQFARRKELKTTPTRIESEIQLIVQQMGDARIHYSDSKLQRPVEADPDALRQILLNILENARAAIEANGRIDVRCRQSGVTVVEIEDDGCGMGRETLSKIYDPFFTTRATGSGLGMAITRRLIGEMRGKIEIESEEDKGTLVKISLP